MKPEIFQCPNIWRVGCNNIRITARKKHDLDPVCCCSVLCYSQTEKKDGDRRQGKGRRVYIWGAKCVQFLSAQLFPLGLFGRNGSKFKSLFFLDLQPT